MTALGVTVSFGACVELHEYPSTPSLLLTLGLSISDMATVGTGPTAQAPWRHRSPVYQAGVIGARVLLWVSIAAAVAKGQLSMVWLLPVVVVAAWLDTALKLSDRPHPFHWPFVGVLISALYNYSRMLHWHLENFARLGPVYYVQMPVSSGWFLLSRDDVEHVLKTNQQNFLQGARRKDIFLQLLGHGIFNADGKVWRMQRKIASHEFTVKKFRTFTFDVFVDHSRTVVDLLKEHARRGTVFDAQDLFSRFTLDSICKIGFGVEVDALTREDVSFMRAFDDATRLTTMRFSSPWWKILRFFNLGSEKRLATVTANVKEFANDIIAQRRKLSVTDLEDNSDLLSRFMLARDTRGEPLSQNMLGDVVLNFILAGRDTTANCLCWLWLELCQHPEVVEKLRQEVVDHVGDKDLDFDTIKNMEYIQAVVSEALRLYPSVPLDFKQCAKTDTLPSGYIVQAGQQIVFAPWHMARQTSIWGADADQFRPDRWLDGEGKYQRVDPFLYPVFQPGPRQCLGINLAQLEVKVLTIELVRNFDLTMLSNQDLWYTRSLTLPMRSGLKLTAKVRRE
eukprot:m.163660 g.163660  ORF g.163660 m.163660 type:complete len:565 (+) comp17695_c1_seq3:212-1906(+)